MGIQDLRRNYGFGSLKREDLPLEPMLLFRTWFEQLQNADVPDWFEINAMTISTSTSTSSETLRTSSRIVLLKHLEEDGFTFFTNYDSEKGQQIAAQPRVALHFFWPIFDRQVRIEGVASKTSTEVSDAYFAARPRSSQLGAIASPQSKPLEDEVALEKAILKLEQKYADMPIPRPDNWGGYRVTPLMIEFWQGKPSRLHDRFRYEKVGSASDWSITRLAP